MRREAEETAILAKVGAIGERIESMKAAHVKDLEVLGKAAIMAIQRIDAGEPAAARRTLRDSLVAVFGTEAGEMLDKAIGGPDGSA